MKESNSINRRDFLFKLTAVGLSAFLFTNLGCSKSDDGYYVVDAEKCTGCQQCLKACKYNAITFPNEVAIISSTRCAGCGKCAALCPNKAISEA